jgi:hypothetical protein
LNSARFSNTPALVSSTVKENGTALLARRRFEGFAMEGDRFALMTDALAQWALKTLEKEGNPFATLYLPTDELAPSLLALEGTAQLRTDDWSLILADVQRRMP